jgi:Tol biopolymer transport system component
VQSALELYKANNGKYPPKETWVEDLVSGGYIPAMPIDPRDGQDIDGESGGLSYGYEYKVSEDGQSFEVETILEGTDKDGDRKKYIGTPEGPREVKVPKNPTTGESCGTLVNASMVGISQGHAAGPITHNALVFGTVSGSSFTGTFQRSGGEGQINGTITNATVSNGKNCMVTALCNYRGNVATDNSTFTGTITSCLVQEDTGIPFDPDTPEILTPTTFGQVAQPTSPFSTRTPTPTHTPTNTPTFTPPPPTPTPLRPDLIVSSITRDATNYTITYCNNGLGTSASTMTIELRRLVSPNGVGFGWDRTGGKLVPSPGQCAAHTVSRCFSTELGGACSDSITVRATVNFYNFEVPEFNYINNTRDQIFVASAPTNTPVPSAFPTVKVYFVSDRDQSSGYNNELYSINENGTGLLRLTTSASGFSVTSPQVAPNGTKIVFSRTEFPNDEEIYTINPNGTGELKLTANTTATDTSPIFFPNSSQILFLNNSSGRYEIYKMNSDGSSKTVLVTVANGAAGFNRTEYPIRSDGAKIAYTRSDASYANDQVYTMNADGTGQTQLTSFATGGYAWGPTYSPDGTKLTFEQTFNGYGNGEEIYVMNATGGGLIRLTNNTSRDNSPRFSPDGLWIYYLSDRNGSGYQVWKIRADGTQNQLAAATSINGGFNVGSNNMIYFNYSWADAARMTLTGASFTMITDDYKTNVYSTVYPR